MTARLLMTASEITTHPAEWQDYRRASIGASEIAVLMGLAPKSHGNPFALFVEKKTGEATIPVNDDMERGRFLEAYVAERLADMRPDLTVLPGGLYRDQHCPWMTATFDRFTVRKEDVGTRLPEFLKSLHSSDPDPDIMAKLIPAELKTALSRNDPATGERVWGEPYTDQIPLHYKAQALWQMAIWGCDTVHVPVLFLGSWQAELYVVTRNDDTHADIEFMLAEASAFLDRIDRDDPPELDWTPETAKALRILQPFSEGSVYRASKTDATRLRNAYKRKKAAEERYGLLQNKLAAKSGGAKKIVTADPATGEDETVMSRSSYPMETIDVKQLRKEKPATAAQYDRVTPVDKWIPGKRWMSGS